MSVLILRTAPIKPMSQPEENGKEAESVSQNKIDIPEYEPPNNSRYLGLPNDKGINDNDNSPPYFGK